MASNRCAQRNRHANGAAAVEVRDVEFEWDADNPLARAKGETRKANDALGDYFGMGIGRSLAKLRQKYSGSGVKTRYSTIANWSVKYHWQDRVDAQSEADNAADREYWADQRRQIRQADLKASVALRDRAEQMRKFPLAQVEKVEEFYKDGRVKAVTIVNPVRWSQADMARFEKVASELARLAAEMEQTRAVVDVTTKGEKISGLTDEERIAALDTIRQRVSAESS